jgi:hypothetical protein
MDTTEAVISPSSEAAFLDEMRRLATRWIGFGFIAAVVGALVLAGQFGEAGVILGSICAGAGLVYVWLGFAWLRLLPKARVALTIRPVDVRLQTRRNLGMLRRSTFAQLWPKDSVTPPSLAQFSETFHWAKPRYMMVDKIPAKIYGTPTKDATVVVSCPDGVLVGRIKRSHL